MVIQQELVISTTARSTINITAEIQNLVAQSAIKIGTRHALIDMESNAKSISHR